MMYTNSILINRNDLFAQVFEVCGREPLIEVAIALERAALSDEYFIKRKLYPNVDFYSGLIYKGIESLLIINHL